MTSVADILLSGARVHGMSFRRVNMNNNKNTYQFFPLGEVATDLNATLIDIVCCDLTNFPLDQLDKVLINWCEQNIDSPVSVFYCEVHGMQDENKEFQECPECKWIQENNS